MYARWTTFLSSRTLPGQAWRSQRARARPGVNALLACSSAALSAARKCCGEQLHVARRARAAAAARSGRRSGDRRGPRAASRPPPPRSGARLVAAIDAHVDLDRARRRRRAAPGRVSSTRSSFTCSSIGISVISSRKSVPPAARSKCPRCRCAAPVKLPRSWPKSSLSIRFGDTAPQLRARNGASPAPAEARGWSARPAPCRCRSRPSMQHGGLGRARRARSGRRPRCIAARGPDHRPEAAELAQLVAQRADLAPAARACAPRWRARSSGAAGRPAW